ALENAGFVPLLRPKKDERCPPFEDVILSGEKRDSEEHLRLLYVALTRAADRLIVSGVRPKERKDGADPRPPNCWHRIVEQAMAPIAAPGIGHVMLGYASGEQPPARRTRAKTETPAAVVPDWAKREAPPEARPPRPLAPSAIAVDDETAPPPSDAMRAAARRGTLIHQLLERLVAVDPERRREAALRWLERSAGVTDEVLASEIADQVCGILSDPQFGALFGPD